MADFRKLFYALAMVAVLVGLSIPASAQGGLVTCNAFTTPTLARAEGYAELVGDYTLQCFGGSPTPPGQPVPSVNITVFLSTNITSKLTNGSSSPFNEALLFIDEQNSQSNPGRGVLNCGNTSSSFVGAPDTSVSSGPGVCQIIATTGPGAPGPGLSDPSRTYDGTPGVRGTPTGDTTAGCSSSASGFGCGRPNVFQGRLGTAQNTGQNSIVVFQGVPFDPPGTTTTRTLRITNIRADAEFLGVSSTFTQTSILMSVAFTNTTFVTINNLSGQQLTVATVLRGLTVGATSQLGFLQCVSENSRLVSGAATRGDNRDATVGGGGVGGGYTQPRVTFTEGFANAWKTKNVAFLQTSVAGSSGGVVGNGILSATGGAAQWAGTINYPGDLAQNATGSNYNTESGWEWVASAAGQGFAAATTPLPSPNPPPAIGTNAVASNGYALFDSQTGIQSAGVATQGTRLALSFSNQPQGLSIWVPPVVLLVNTLNSSLVTGVMVLTNTAADGSGAFAPPSGITAGGASNGVNSGAGNPTIGTNALVPVSNNLAVYEILFSDPNAVETTTVPVVVGYVSNLSANPPIGLPVPNQIEQVAGSFAPFYSSATARQPSATLPVPRFIPSNSPLNLIAVVKCACNTLFPFVSAAAGFDTGIAVANTSLDPGAAVLGIGATPQQGTVTFYYFGVGNNGSAPPASQTSAVVPAGQVLTYVLSSGGGGIGTGANGLDNRANGFQGYIIAQAGFQYCHSFAFIGPLGGGPLSPGVSEGYLGLILDRGGLVRTTQFSENLVH